MNDPLVGGFRQRRGDLPHYRHDELYIRQAAARHQLAKVLPSDVLLGDVLNAVDAADFVNLHDVGMDEGRGRLSLHLEAANVGGVFGQFALEDLERDLPA